MQLSSKKLSRRSIITEIICERSIISLTFTFISLDKYTTNISLPKCYRSGNVCSTLEQIFHHIIVLAYIYPLSKDCFVLGSATLFIEKIMQDKDWFRIKKYPHIDFPIENKDRHKWLQNYITNPEKIAKHSFLPFIHKVSKKRKFRKKYDAKIGKIILTEDGKKRHKDIKVRELFYASHLDSLIFSYYNHLIYTPYEEKLKEFHLEEVVTAYRRIPKNKENPKGSNKCNIDFANDIFKIIKNYSEEKFAVITFDIKSFFDNINHNLLRKSMMGVLGVQKLSNDFFNVFKNITRFSYVDIQDIFREYQNEIICKKTNRKGIFIKEVNKYVPKLKFLRNQEAIAFCYKNDFLKNKKHLIKSHKFVKDEEGNLIPRNFGIPQGSPISSTLANLYLLHFDKKNNDFITSKNGFYRRYSDDMIVVCQYSDIEEIEKLFYEEIRNYQLEIQPQKTQKFIFEREKDTMKCGQVFENNVINWNKNLIYLGFEYDGKKVLLKSASLAGFYRKMKKSILRGKYLARISKREVFKRRLYKKYTFRGARRYKIYKWCNKEKKFKPTSQQNWGNFLSYAKKASNIMEDNQIKGQIKNHWRIFHRKLGI